MHPKDSATCRPQPPRRTRRAGCRAGSEVPRGARSGAAQASVAASRPSAPRELAQVARRLVAGAALV